MVPRLIQISRIECWSCLFSTLDRKQPYWTNLVKKSEIANLSWNLVPWLIRICRIQWWCSFFLLYTENTLLSTFGPTNQNCQFKLNLVTAIIFIIFWDSLMFYQVKRSAVIINKHDIYELTHELPKNLRLRMLIN